MQSEAARKWQRAKELFDLVIARDPGERFRILEIECGTDAELLREVQSLIEIHENSPDFMEASPAPLDLLSIQETSPLASEIGSRIGPWSIVTEIGRGGMGTVFLARRADDVFEKNVAIKVVRRSVASDFILQRFRSERQILATLEHPNIARLIDGGSTAEGLPYFIMEYVEGLPLTTFCNNRNLAIRDRVRIFLDVCAAVQYAHQRNIVHRDLKPTNVLVRDDGTAKLLDFGIARLIADSSEVGNSEVTATGFRMMTPAYASPEQLRGEPSTTASDLYSLGVLLYEILCGHRPSPLLLATTTVPAPSRAVQRRDETAPESLAKQRGTTVEELIAELAGLDEIVLKAIQFHPSDRYSSVEAFAAGLRQYLSGSAFSTSTRPFRRSLAVLPFRTIGTGSPTDQHLSTSLADSLITKLSALRNVSVCSTSSVMRFAGADPIEAGIELGADFVLEGRIYTTDTRVRVNVQLMSVREKSTLWASQFDEPLTDLLRLQDSLSGQVSLALVPQLSGTEARDRERRQTSSAKAYQKYLKGRWYWSQRSEDNLAKALLCFQEALAEDPQYPNAHAGVADYYNRLGVRGGLPPRESFAAAKEAARRAVAIDPSLAEAHASLGFAMWGCDRNYSAAEAELQKAVELDPNSAEPHHWLGMLYSSLGRHEEAIANCRKAYELDSSAAIAARYANALLNVGESGKALEVLRDEHGGDPNHWLACEAQAWCYLDEKNIPKALEAAQRAVDLSERDPGALCCLAITLIESHNSEAARRILVELTGLARRRYVSAYFLALICQALGEENHCLNYLEKAADEGDLWVLWTGVQRRFTPLRNNRRFKRLLARLADEKHEESIEERKPWPGILSSAIVAGILCVAVALAFWKFGQPSRVPFLQPDISRLTTDGTAVHAAISSDGKYVAYSVRVDEGQELWLQRRGVSGAVRLFGPARAELHRIAFYPDNSYVTYVATPWTEPADAVFYRAPVVGGSPAVLMKNVPGPVSLSPDGSHIALIRPNAAAHRDELALVNLDGGEERVLASRTYPDRFSWPSTPAWSPDGAMIVCGAEGSDAEGFRIGLIVVRVKDGKVRILQRPRWQFLEQAAWHGRTGGLLAVGQQANSSFQQIWYVPLGSGEPKPVINDLNDYTGLTVTGDAREMVSVRIQAMANVYVMKAGDRDRTVQITPGSGRYFDLSWTPDGRILYSSDATGTADIGMMNADGSGKTQLTAGTYRSYSPVASPSGNVIVFHSNRNQNWNLWRMNSDGRDVRQLTFGSADSNWPQFTPDGKWVVYHHTGNDGLRTLWKVPVEGGTPVQLTRQLTMYPSVSPKDGRIACWFSVDVAKPHWKLAIVPAEGGDPVQTFSVPTTVGPDTALRWTPDGKAITFIDSRNGSSNLWLQPVDGSPAHALTSLKGGQIYSFSWSSDGTLAYSRGLSTSDAVLLRDVQR
jgi:serine/threonine protein kinase/Tol biopolymer transport system component/Flp pilus assembly protein TadD